MPERSGKLSIVTYNSIVTCIIYYRVLVVGILIKL